MKRIYIASPSSAAAIKLQSLAEEAGKPYLVCGRALETEAALADLSELRPEILLADAEMPGTDSSSFTALASSVLPGLIIVTASDILENISFVSAGTGDKKPRQENLREALQTACLYASSADSAPDLTYRLYQHIMRHVFGGERSPAALLEDAALLRLPLDSEFYQVLACHLDAAQPSVLPLISALLRETFPLHTHFLYFFNEYDELLVLVQADTYKELAPRTEAAAGTLRTVLRNFDLTVTSVTGSVLRHLGQIPEAAAEARRLLTQIRRLSPGQAVNVEGSLQQHVSVSWNESFSFRCEGQLLHAGEAELPALLQSYLQRTDEKQLSDTLYRYYLLMDILHSAIQVAAADSGRDIQETAAEFGEVQDILAAAVTRSTFEAMALVILKKAISLRDDLRPEMRRENVIQRAAHFIQENFGDAAMSLQQAARYVGFSPTHFSTVFAKKMGCTFIAYLTDLRIKRAKELLAGTDAKLAEIAMEVGYNDPNYFSHVFKRREGISPREYRHQAARRKPSSGM